MNTALEKQIENVIAPVVESMGFDLVRTQFSGSGKRTLQIMAERADGSMTVDDCALLSREISAILDVEDPIPGEYLLEVSSPGLDRPLTRLKDFDRFKGFEAKLQTLDTIDGRKRFRGILQGVSGDQVALEMEGAVIALPFSDIAKAKLVITDELLKAHSA